ncbi:MAG: glycosyltransferase family 4 protein [bacterium]
MAKPRLLMAMRGDYIGEPSKGGLFFSRDIALYLSNFMDIYLIGKDKIEDKKGFWMKKNIQSKNFPFLDPFKKKLFPSRPFDAFLAIRKSLEEIKKANPDIIYAQELDFLYLTKLSKPFVLHIHGCFKEMLALRYPKMWRNKRIIPNWLANYIGGCLHLHLIRKFLPKIDKIFLSAHSEQLSFLKAKEPLIGAKTVSVPLIVDTETFVPMDRKEARTILGLPQEHRIFLFVGGLDPLKAPDHLVQAFSIFKKHHPKSLLLFIGRGTMKGLLKRQVERLGLEKDVLFLGRIPHDRLPLYYNSADVFALPSLYEGISLVTLEALSCGTPIVVTPVVGASEFIRPGIEGFVVEEGDIPSLAEALLHSVNLPPEARELCRKVALRFSKKEVGDYIHKILLSLLGK